MNKGSSYTAKLKLKVTSKNEKTNNSVAAYLFSIINDKFVNGWNRAFLTLEEAINTCVLDTCQYGFIMMGKMITDPTEFIKSSDWCIRFMEHLDLCPRQKIKIAQKFYQIGKQNLSIG